MAFAPNVYGRVFYNLRDVADDRPVAIGVYRVNTPEAHRFDDPKTRSVGRLASLNAREIRKLPVQDAGRHARDPAVDGLAGCLFVPATAPK